MRNRRPDRITNRPNTQTGSNRTGLSLFCWRPDSRLLLIHSSAVGSSGSSKSNERIGRARSSERKTRMAMRSAVSRASVSVNRLAGSASGATRFFSDGKGKILSEEERAAENVYIKVLDFFIFFLVQSSVLHFLFPRSRGNPIANAFLRFRAAIAEGPRSVCCLV